MSTVATKITISADDRASAAFRKVGGEADSLVKKLVGMGPKVGDVLGNLGLGSLGIGVGASQIAGLVKESSLLAANYDMLGVAVEFVGTRMGFSTQQIQEQEKKLVSQGIALQQTRQAMINMATANLDLTRTTELATAAQNVSSVKNLNSSETLERMIYAITSAQPEMLRTIGLTVDFNGAYGQMAKNLGKNATALTANEKQQARFNATLEAASNYAGLYDLTMGKAGKQLSSFERHVSNLKTLLGEMSLETLSISVFGVNSSLEDLNNRLMEMKDSGELQEISQSLGEGFGAVVENVDNAAVAIVAWYAAVKIGNSAATERLTVLAKEHGILATLRSEITGNTAALGGDTAAQIANTEALIANHKARLAILDTSIAAKQGILSDIVNMPESAANLEVVQTRKQYEKELKVLQGERVIVTRQLARETDNLTAATGRGNVALRAMNSLKAGAGNLISLMGGPYVLAFTAAAGAIYYLATQESEAAKYARQHAQAMQMVSEDAETAKRAIESYASKLAQMNKERLEFERADVARSIEEVLGSNAAYREAVNSILPLGLFTKNFDEIQRRAKEINQVLLNENFASATVEQLKEARTEYVKLAAETNRTKEAAKGLEVFDVLISLKERADMAADAVGRISESAQSAASSLLDLSSVNFGSLLSNVNFEIEKLGLNERNKAIIDGLLKGDLLKPENIQISKGSFSVTGVSEESLPLLAQYETALGKLFDRQQAVKSSSQGAAKALSALNDTLAKSIGFSSGSEMESLYKDVSKGILELGMDEKQKQMRAFNEEMERMQRLLASGFSMPGVPSFSQEQFDAYKAQRTKEITTGRTVERDRQLLVDFEKEYLEVMKNSEAAQIASIRERAAEYESAGAEAVRVAQWQAEMELRYSRDATAGMKVAFSDYANESANMAKNTANLVTGSFDAIKNAFSLTTEGMKFDWKSMLDTILNQSFQAIAINPLMGALSKGLGNFAGGFFSFDSGGVTETTLYAHQGGMVGSGLPSKAADMSWFVGAARYHGGGPILAPGEVPIIAQLGERVLTERQNQLWEKMLGGGVSAQPIDLSVRLINESGQQLEATKSQTQWSVDMKQGIVTVWLDAFNRNAFGLRDAIGG